MRDVDYSSAVDFLESFFRGAEHAIDIRALANDADQKPVQRFSRDSQIILDTCERYDGIGRGIFFGVATRLNGSHSGKREDLAELPGLWVDIDCYKLGITKETALDALRSCPLPPTVVVDSGGGLHAYWLFHEPLDARFQPQVGKGDTVKDEIDAALRQLAGVFAGDMRSCDITRVLRLVGTHNTKDGTLRPVGIFEASGKRYELSDVLDMLDYLRPLIEAPQPPLLEQDAALERNPYTEFAARYGFKAPIDVEQRLRAMSYMAAGDAGVHITQLACSASLVASGHASDDEIVSALMSATQAAAGHYGMSWNWSREEKRVYDMVRTARAKYGRAPPPQSAPRPLPDKPADLPPPGGKASGTTGEIVDLDARRRPKAPPKDDDAPVIAKLGDAVIGYWEETYGLLISTGLGMATYSAAVGIWTHFDKELELRLRVTIQGIFAAAGAKPQSATINAVLHYIKDRPALYREGVAWDASGYIVCRNCCVNPETRETRDFSPELYATFRVDCDYDEEAACPKFVEFLAKCLEGGTPLSEAKKVVETIGEHMGASLVRGKPRNLRKALYVVGATRSGKTSLAEIYRALLGGDGRCSALKASDLNDHYSIEKLSKKAAWIADDVIEQGGGRRRFDAVLNSERLKTIITGEQMSPRMVGGGFNDVRLDIPVMWTGNNLPQFFDDSKALYNRLLLGQFNGYWPEDAPNPDPAGREIHLVLTQDELSGILNFAIHSYARLKVRGYYDPPPSMVAALEELREANQPLVTWMQECIELDEHTRVDYRDLMGALRGWWTQQYGDEDRPPGGRTTLKALRRFYTSAQPERSHGERLMGGVGLTEEGVACLRHAQGSGFGYDKTIGSGLDAGLVNLPRPNFPGGP